MLRLAGAFSTDWTVIDVATYINPSDPASGSYVKLYAFGCINGIPTPAMPTGSLDPLAFTGLPAAQLVAQTVPVTTDGLRVVGAAVVPSI